MGGGVRVDTHACTHTHTSHTHTSLKNWQKESRGWTSTFLFESKYRSQQEDADFANESNQTSAKEHISGRTEAARCKMLWFCKGT